MPLYQTGLAVPGTLCHYPQPLARTSHAMPVARINHHEMSCEVLAGDAPGLREWLGAH